MLSRTTTTLPARASSMRRMRRRAVSSIQRLYCATNGCASFLDLDPSTGTASCRICGFTRRLS